MQSDAPLPGPDLQAGVPLSAVPVRGVLAGHAGGEPVLLVRPEIVPYASYTAAGLLLLAPSIVTHEISRPS